MRSYNTFPLDVWIEQSHYQWYRDDGDLSSSTPIANEDATASVSQNGVARVRLQLNTYLSGSDTLYQYLLEYRVSGDGGQSWSDWNDVGSATVGVQIVASSHYNDGDAVTSPRLTPSASAFVSGEAVETARPTGFITLPIDRYTELEWCLRFGGANIGELYQFRAIAYDGFSYYLLSSYAVYAQAVIQPQESEEGTMFFEQYTRAGWGFEKSNERSGRWVKAQQGFNLLRRLPVPNVEQFAYGGFRGTEVPVGYRAGRFSDQRITIECELTLDTISTLLACFLGQPATTGTGPYTHNFYSSSNPNKAGRPITVWQRWHDQASDEPPGDKLIGYGGVAVETLRLRGEKGVRGGVLTVEANALFLTAVEANEDGTILAAAPYGSELPLVVDDILLMLRDTSGNIPTFAPHIGRIDLTLQRTVFVRFEFDGKYIPSGYFYREPRITAMELEVYRTTNIPVRLVWGNTGSEPFLPTTSETNRRYQPSGQAALTLILRSQTNAAHELRIELPNLHFLSLQERSVDSAVYDTLTVMPVYSATDKTNLRKIELVNAQPANAIIPPDASITQFGTALTGVYSPY